MTQRAIVTNEYTQKRHRKKVWQRVVASLAAVVVFCTTYALILPAITATNAVYCGYEEAHSEACYETERVLICQQEESEEHHHTDACYTEERHLICQKPVHQHTRQCFSDPEADVESQSTWDKMFANLDLTEDWSRDVLTVAQSQLGYRESDRNYRVLADGETRNGYTRYGDWYGSPYGDWCAMFCAFCLDYAGVKDYPVDANCGSWIAALSEDENDPGRTVYYHEAGTYTPQPGDLIFFDWDGDKAGEDAQIVDHVGFVAELIEATNDTSAQIKTIEGNNGDKVAYHTYDMDSPQILGYGELPENPEQIVAKSVTMKNGVKVTVSAPNSSLPYPAEDIDLTAELITSGEAEGILTSCLKEEGIGYSDIMLIDVCLMHQGMEIEPIGPVTLTFDAGSAIDASAVYHVDERNETITDMKADITADGLATMETDHFSTFALTDASAKKVTATVNATWNQNTKQFSSLTVTASSPDLDNCYYTLSSNNGSDWTVSSNSSYWSAKTGKNTTASVPTTALNNAAIDTEFRVHGALDITKPNENNKSGYSTSFTILDLCEKEKSGFKNWLQNSYVQSFGGTRQPQNLTELYEAFAVYYALPTLTVDSTFANNQLTLTASTDFSGTPTYKWEYYDTATGSWVTMQGETGATLNASNHAELNGGKDVRCSLYEGATLKATTVAENVNPLRKIYDDAIAQINAGLKLKEYPVTVGTGAANTISVDISIHGTKYDNYFYWTNLANDSRVPFTDGDSYADYLASEYLKYSDPSEGLAAVKKIWDKYLYDMYDPILDGKYITNTTTYPNDTYGDQNPDFIKDKNSSSFHGTSMQTPTVERLNYDYLEEGVDYKNFISGLDKSATAVASGDNNAERKYLIDITADAQAKAAAPVAMILQIQTAWQLFDLMHANAQSGQGETQVGSASYNTELANLYDIKQALLRFVDYMEEKYPGNNLVLGITETRHDASQTMFLGTDSHGNNLYVTNNWDTLTKGIEQWDTFGNCEHVHYDSKTLEAAVSKLSDNLDTWTDFYDQRVKYEDIEKVAVIIGGPTEDSASTNGYACTLPWSTFTSKGINSVYGIRVNEGTSVNGSPISWLDYSGNNDGAPYSYSDVTNTNTGGNSFTKKYVATTEDAVFRAMVQIAETEMLKKGLDIQATDKYVEGVTVDDTVTYEFVIDPSIPFTATVYNSDKYGQTAERGKKASECVINWQTGQVERTTYTAGVANQPTAVIQGNRTVTVDAQNNKTTTITFTDADGDHTLTIVENAQTSGGTSTVTYDFDKVYNTKKCNLNFGIVARDDYIGSNNVYTNVGTPDLDYKHYKIDSNGNPVLNPTTGEKVYDSYQRICADTPEVNVPIRFTTTDGELKKVLLNTDVDLGTDTDLNSHVITAAVEELVDNYDQINGTLQYTWVLPNGTRVPCGAVAVQRGVVQGDFPSLDYNYLANTTGLKECKLEVTFTPDAFENNPNFKKDGVTNVKVNEVMHPGSVWIEAVSADSKLNYYIRKEWKPETPTDITAVDYRLSDGQGGYVKQVGSGYEITSNADEATVFHLNAAGNWQSLITGLPPVKTVNGQTVILNYQAEELNIPDGYEVSYGSAMQTDEEWQGYLRVTLKPTEKVIKNDAKYLYIKFSYDGTTYEKKLPLTLSADLDANKTLTVDFKDVLLPLNGKQPLGDISIVNIFTYKEIKNGAYDKANNTLLANSTAEAVPVLTGSVSTPVLVMTNSEAGQRLKLVKTNQLGQLLPSAAFALYASDSDGNQLDIPMAGYENLVSNANGEFTPTEKFSLPNGTYYLVETKVPDGYNAPATPVKFVVNTNGITVVEGNAQTVTQDGVITVKVQNSAGYELPKTGGAGTTLYTLGGLLLMAGAVMYGCAVRRKREGRGD